ncbi:hypothetical protein CaCOL14_001660 [Colletotrichum acutatum]
MLCVLRTETNTKENTNVTGVVPADCLDLSPTARVEQHKNKGNGEIGEEWVGHHSTVGAFEILDGEDREIQQLIGRDLVDEANRGFEVVWDTLDISRDTSTTRLSIAIAFLKVITHPVLLDSLSIC